METRSRDRKRSSESASKNKQKVVDSCTETNNFLSLEDQQKQGKGFRVPGLSSSKEQTTNKERKVSTSNSEHTVEDLQPSTSGGEKQIDTSSHTSADIPF